MSQQFQQILDEHKKELNDNLYLKLCNANKNNFNNDKISVEVEYAYPQFNFEISTIDDYEKDIFVGIKKDTQTLSITREEINTVKNCPCKFFPSHKIAIDGNTYILMPIITNIKY